MPLRWSSVREGITPTGAIELGFRADLVAMRDDFTVTQTWIGGVPSA